MVGYGHRVALGAAMWCCMASAHAATVTLRVRVDHGSAGATPTIAAAQVGDVGLTPSQPAHAGDARWRIVARDAQGRALRTTVVRGHARRHLETFDPGSGQVVRSVDVANPDDAFEVTMPFDADVARIDVEPETRRASAAGQTSSDRMQAAVFDRSTLARVARQAPLAAQAAGATATTIIDNGAAATHMDYVFLGDGYTEAEMDKWRADAQKVIDGFMADPLFAANRTTMNVRRVDIASAQSGVDEPDRGIARSTAMDASFNCYNIARLLCVNTTKVANIAASVLPADARDVLIVVANSARYGGSGGQVATLSMATQASEIVLHEIGHTAFGLADEYDYGTCDLTREPGEGDVSKVSTRAVKWGSFIASATPVPTGVGQVPNGTVGVFQGAQYCPSGKYRPTENSRMRTLGYPWHAVNEALARAVFAGYGGSTPPGGGGVTETGTLGAGGSAGVPRASPGYVQGGAGVYAFALTGPASANFDLALYRWSGSAWTQVAAGNGATSNETIRYTGSAGYYYAVVRAVSGSGAYSVTYSYPAP